MRYAFEQTSNLFSLNSRHKKIDIKQEKKTGKMVKSDLFYNYHVHRILILYPLLPFGIYLETVETWWF